MRLLAFTFGMFGIVGVALGQWIPFGEAFQVNTETFGEVTAPVTAMDTDGNFVVVWTSPPDGSEDLRGQRFHPDGARLGEEFQVSTYTTGRQRGPAIAAGGAGSFMVVWQSDFQDGDAEGIRGQRLGAGGAMSELQINTYTTDSQRNPDVAVDGAGNFIVVWVSQGQDGHQGGIFGQRFASDGTPAGTEFQVNVYTGGYGGRSQSSPAVVAATGGDFLVVWQSVGVDGSGYGIQGRRYSSSGSALGGEFQVNTATYASQIAPAAAMAPSGEFVIAWYSYQPYFYVNSVNGQRFDASGAMVGDEFEIDVPNHEQPSPPGVTMADDGRFVVAWTSYNPDRFGFDVHGRPFGSHGSPLGADFRVNTSTLYFPKHPSVAMDDGGRFVVVWQATYQEGILGQLYDEGLVFGDGFESGDTLAWSLTVP